ncbi:MAG TPA: cupin domain-containing protein [Terriglobia bacterium]|nr:cupin domain-containing protein [Terriglobia bacterium]
MDYSRREMCLLLPALMALKAQGSSTSVIPSKAYPFESQKAQADGQNKFRPIFDGTTHERFHVALHATDLAPGSMPHPPHHHAYEEIFLVREGTVAVTIAGRESTLGPGSVAYVASNDEHGIRNAGTTHAQYFVFELGSDRS